MMGETNEIRTLDLFSGIGGFALGLERAGPFRTVAFCERDPYAQRVLKKHWPEVPIYDDVRTIDTDELGRIDLVCGGWPCQPWSVAGQQRGAEDDRDLWPAMVALVEELRPRFVLGENVRGFVNEPMGLPRTLADLERIGFQAVTFIIPAAAVGARHRRDRCWIVAHSVADASGPRLEVEQRQRRHDGKEREAAKRSSDGRKGWLPEPNVGRVANGVPSRVDRLKCLGNAVVPQVVEQLGRAILEAEKK
jgi:DNA (cytosine-5)-methyltransferase 1